MSTVFLIGISPRCGSNYLANLLIQHPVLKMGRLHKEDHLVSQLHHLKDFSMASRQRWGKKWYVGKEEGLKNDLTRSLGEAIDRFQADGEMRIAKTPLTEGLPLFREFFPNNKLILLCRDGHAAVESGVRSSFWNFYRGSIQWRKGARDIIQACSQEDKNTRLVHYERLVASPEQEIRSLLEWLSLDADEYDWHGLANMAVHGSSQYGQSANGYQRTLVREKPVDFAPLARAESWSVIKRARFFLLAAKELKALEYECSRPSFSLLALASLLNLASTCYLPNHEPVRRRLRQLKSSTLGPA